MAIFFNINANCLWFLTFVIFSSFLFMRHEHCNMKSGIWHYYYYYFIFSNPTCYNIIIIIIIIFCMMNENMFSVENIIKWWALV